MIVRWRRASACSEGCTRRSSGSGDSEGDRVIMVVVVVVVKDEGEVMAVWPN